MDNDLISRSALLEAGSAIKINEAVEGWNELPQNAKAACIRLARENKKLVMAAPAIDPESLRPKGRYTAHEVAEIIADLFGDCCACNFNGIDEWLPSKCELIDACPNTVGVACWEQYLKYRDAKKEV